MTSRNDALTNPFPSAVVHVDENADLDVIEAQRDAPPAGFLYPVALHAATPSKIELIATLPGLVSDQQHASTSQSSWTIYTETLPHGPKCFALGTEFVGADGIPVPVHALSIGRELQGPGKTAFVTKVVAHSVCKKVLKIKIGNSCDFYVLVTHDHRILLQKGDYRRACDLKPGDLICTTEGENVVASVEEGKEPLPVFEVTFADDRPVYFALQNDEFGKVAAFGSDQTVPYNPDELVEFRFKGPMCASMGLAEAWLSSPDFNGKFDDYGLKFWCTRKFAVWVPRAQANDFWEQVTEQLPQGSKLYRRPSVLSEYSTSVADRSMLVAPSVAHDQSSEILMQADDELLPPEHDRRVARDDLSGINTPPILTP